VIKTLSLSFFCVTALAFSALVGCSEDVGFSGGNGSATAVEAPDPNINAKTENFSALGNQVGAADLVWVIDNSGSMNEEAAHVRENLEAFTQYVDGRADLKMAVISNKRSSKNGVELPSGLDPERFIHIDQVVQSRDSLSLLDQYLSTTLSTFLRPDVDKVFVIVTDDNSEISAEVFTTRFHQTYPDVGFSLHGFIAFNKSTSPCGAKQGTVYEALAANTGSLFNICERDWTDQFSKLAESVVAQVRTSFKLDSSVKAEEISSVVVNGIALEASNYEMADNVLSINNSVLQGAESFSIQVTYTYSAL